MRHRFVVVLFTATFLACLIPSPTALAQSRPEVREPTLLMLDDAVQEMTAELTEYAQSLPDKQKAYLIALLEKQKTQLEKVQSKYKGALVSSRERLAIDLRPFFATGSQIRMALQQPKGSVQATQYSPDPSHCANHCIKTCGYNSLGEKICWYNCYRCCGKGGC
jgi:hypothetical protein